MKSLSGCCVITDQPFILHMILSSMIGLNTSILIASTLKKTSMKKILETSQVNSTEQCADIFTKGLPIKTFSKLISKLGMKNIHSCA